MGKVAFYTLGCKVNQYETDTMKAMFLQKGYEVTDFENIADIYVVNTCTVTAMGDKKSRQIIHGTKAKNSNAIVVVTGCMAQNALKDGITIEGADIVLGNENRKHIVETVEEFCGGNQVINISEINKERNFWESDGIVSEDRTRAYIKIQDGCDRYCSYCIIPYVRGPVRSRKPEEVISEAKKMRDQGFSEIVVIGIHLASYGKDLKTNSLIEILEELNNIEGIERVRLGSLEPGFINEESIEKLKSMEKVCKHFHLSLQSGCDSVLKRMNRRYTTAEFEEKVNMIRNAFPDAAITTDIIVGFPGETEEEFNETFEYLKRINLSKMHIFPYSIRKGTPAATMPNQIEKSVKKERVEKLMELSLYNEIAFAKKFIGKKMLVILENRENNGYQEGYNAQYVKSLIKNGKAHEEIWAIGKKVLDDGSLICEKMGERTQLQ